MIYSRHCTMMYTLVLLSVEHGKNRIFDFLFDLQLRQDEQLGAVAYASEAGSIHVASRLMTLPSFDEHLKSFLRGEDYNGVPKTAEFIEYIAEFLYERVDVSQYGLELALSGCMHGYFNLYFYGIPGIYLDHLDGDLAAYCVSSRQVVDYLLSKGEDTYQLLLEAVGTGPVDVIQYLLAKDGIEFKRSATGIAFQASLYRRGSDVLSLLLEDPRTRFRENALAYACNACQDGGFEWVRTLLKTMQIDPNKGVDKMTDAQLDIHVDSLCGLENTYGLVSGQDHQIT
ncbi:hypothetical protein EDD86DRAFT_250568 [Gorgonomyces haynaldii]|nr:hypothetical protein EDD86DRAFT_250568 [Gorgonomyces haynaldii]